MFLTQAVATNGFPFEIKRQSESNPYASMTKKEMLAKLEKSREQGMFRDADHVISDMRQSMDYVDNIDYGNRMITMKNQEQMAIGTTYVKFLREQLRNVHDMWQRKRLLQDTGDVLG